MKSKLLNIMLAIAAAVVVVSYVKSRLLGPSAGAVGIIGGADGPTAIFLASKVGGGINYSTLSLVFIGILGVGYGVYKWGRKN